MKKFNLTWTFILLFSLGLTAYFSYFSFPKIYQYYTCSHTQDAQILQWGIAKVKNKYKVFSKFSFNTDGQTILSENSFDTEYLSQAAAHQALKNLSQKKWKSHYNPKKPQQAYLQKKFPYNECFRTILPFIILIYFLFIKSNYKLENN